MNTDTLNMENTMNQTSNLSHPDIANGTHHKMTLDYDLANLKLTVSDNGDVLPDRTIHLKVGHTLEFSSPQGDVNLVCEPEEGFKPYQYSTGSTNILVQPEAPPKGKIWCGVVLEGVIYGYPANKLDDFGCITEVS
jgi:hypothetical protein